MTFYHGNLSPWQPFTMATFHHGNPMAPQLVACHFGIKYGGKFWSISNQIRVWLATLQVDMLKCITLSKGMFHTLNTVSRVPARSLHFRVRVRVGPSLACQTFAGERMPDHYGQVSTARRNSKTWRWQMSQGTQLPVLFHCTPTLVIRKKQLCVD